MSIDLLQRRREMMGGVTDPYPEMIKNKIWDSNNGEFMSAPTDAEGFCVTPFYEMTYNKGMNVTIKAGFTTADYPKACHVFKQNPNDPTVIAAYLVSSNPRTISAANPRYKYISASFKMSEIDDCYIYDNKSNQYLFKGKNV